MQSFRHYAASVIACAAAIGTQAALASGNTPKAAPAGEWLPIGSGEWHEGLLTPVAEIESGTAWKVEVEQLSNSPGWYRILPYHEASPLAGSLGTDSSNHAVINASDPLKVYIVEFTPFGIYTVSQLVPENEWSNHSAYGTLDAATGLICFPAESFSIKTAAGWQITDTDGTFSILLPANAGTASPADGDDGDTPRYFNLQGMPVAVPVAGQPLIRRTATSATKVVIR